MFTRTEWYVVPLFWGPITLAIFLRSALQFSNAAPSSIFDFGSLALGYITVASLAKTTALFALGLFIWTLLEYVHHRFLFHVDRLLPDTPAFLTLHFMIHGVHHYLPMDQ